MSGSARTRTGVVAVAAICLAQVLAMSLWFATTPVMGQMTEALQLSAGQVTLMALAIQAGFVAGALILSTSGLVDAVPPRVMFAGSAVVGAVLTLVLIALPAGNGATAIGLRLLTGVCMAGIYSAALKAAAGWFRRQRGVVMGSLVAGLILGTASPHLLAGLEQNWRITLAVTAALSIAGALVMLVFAHPGPELAPSRRFSVDRLRQLLHCRPFLLTVGGYLGHMWELYAYWGWVGMYLSVVASRRHLSSTWVVLATFAVIAIGAMGSITAGLLADRFGRERIIVVSLAISGSCAALSPAVANAHEGFVLAMLIIWGFFVVSDSAQLSALAADVTSSRDHGTALSLQLALGFAITMLTIAGSEWIALRVGWDYSLIWLALGPGIGIICVLRLLADRRAEGVAISA